MQLPTAPHLWCTAHRAAGCSCWLSCPGARLHASLADKLVPRYKIQPGLLRPAGLLCAGTVACVQLRLSTLRSALRDPPPVLRELGAGSRGRAGRAMRERKLAPGALAEDHVRYSSAGAPCVGFGACGVRLRAAMCTSKRAAPGPAGRERHLKVPVLSLHGGPVWQCWPCGLRA